MHQEMDEAHSRNSSPASAALEGLPGLFSRNEEDDYDHALYFSELTHSLHLLKGLNRQRMENVLCDVIICVGDCQFPCHRNVLAACSPYFLAMFSADMRECSQLKVPIEGMDPGTMKELIDFAYTSDITINKDNAQHLLSAANMVQIACVREACCRFLEKEMDPSNCLGIHCFAEAHVCDTLSRVAKEYALEQFTDVAKHDEIMLLPRTKLIEFLESDALIVESEEIVLQTVINWVHYDPEHREPKLVEVMEYVRLPLVNPYFLFDIMDSEPMLTRNTACRTLLDEAMKYYTLKDRHSELQTPRTRSRNAQVCHDLMITVGGEIYNKNYLNNMDCYDFTECRWMRLKELPFARCHHGTVLSDNKYIYVAGGFNKEKHILNNVLRYETMLDKWTKVANMNTPRARHGMATLDGYIYAVGGYDGQTRIDTVERYNPEMNTWFNVQPMGIALSRCQAVGFKGALYVAGGTIEPNNQCSATLQRYTPTTDTWEWLTPMPVARGLFGLVATRGQLYAVGGTEEMVNASKKLFSYNTETNRWTELAEMIEPRFDAGVVVIKDKIFVLSGHDGENSFYSSIEEYNIDTNSWMINSTASFPYGRCRFGSVSLNIPPK